jgi:hypothetical protein
VVEEGVVVEDADQLVEACGCVPQKRMRTPKLGEQVPLW